MAKEAMLASVRMVYADDGILYLTILPNARIDVKHVQAQNDCIRNLCGDTRVPVLLDARVDYTVTKEAQEYAAMNSNRLATAVLVSSPVVKALTNTFVALFRPDYPVRQFTSEEPAVAWLKEIMRGKK
ncbi:MAG TPA: hypothetical protein VFU15_08795 [Bacteroidia bacterium]|nr:hypothetical protein [Bacteroidia bacterium]